MRFHWINLNSNLKKKNKAKVKKCVFKLIIQKPKQKKSKNTVSVYYG